MTVGQPGQRQLGRRIAPLVLQALDTCDVRLGDIRAGVFAEYVGYSQTAILFAIRHLREHGLVFDRHYSLTERGKIALAIWRGKGRPLVQPRPGFRSDIHRSALADADTLRVTP